VKLTYQKEDDKNQTVPVLGQLTGLDGFPCKSQPLNTGSKTVAHYRYEIPYAGLFSLTGGLGVKDSDGFVMNDQFTQFYHALDDE
jgi:hypothetical protein